MCMALTEMCHAQPPTPAVRDSATGDEFSNNNIRQWHSRAADMKFYWVRERVRKGQFLVYWMTGEHNMADYLTKHHPTSHHWSKRSTYLVPTVDTSKYAYYISPNNLLGCVESPPPREMDDRKKKSPYSMGRKRMMYGRRETGLLGIHNINGDNIGLIAPLI